MNEKNITGGIVDTDPRSITISKEADVQADAMRKHLKSRQSFKNRSQCRDSRRTTVPLHKVA